MTQRLLDLSKMSKLTERNIRAFASALTGTPIRRNTQLIPHTLGIIAPNGDDGLKYFGERYNNEIKQIRKEAHRQAQQNYVKNKKFKTLIETRDEFDFTFDSAEQFVKLIQNIPNDKKFLTSIGGKQYTLNAKTKKRLQEIVMEGVDGVANEANSDYELIEAFDGDTTTHFKKLTDNTGYRLNEGGFFKFTSTLPIDLTDLQIMTVFDANLVEDNCFLKALKKSGIVPEKVPAICSIVIGRDIPQRMLKEIAEKFEIYITVDKQQDGIKTTKRVEYGIKCNPHLPLGLIEEHYFLIKEMPFTSYAIKNYNTLKDKKNWNEFIKSNARDKNRFINSYDLILLMKECGYFKPLEM